MSKSKDALERAALLVGCSATAAYDRCFAHPPLFKWMTEYSVGQTVMEITAFHPRYWHDGRSVLDHIGVLEEITTEPIDMEWDEAEDGPHPKERVFYLRTFDGRRFRWTNARLIRVPDQPSLVYELMDTAAA